MKIKLRAALAALGMSGNALAYFDCAIAEPPNHQAEVLVTGSKTIRLLADQAASDSTPLEKLIAPAMSTPEIRIVCQNTDFVHGRAGRVPRQVRVLQNKRRGYWCSFYGNTSQRQQW